MITPASIIKAVASLMNDTSQDVYTSEACLPYFNMALTDCQEEFQVNSVPSTDKKSEAIPIDAGVTEVGFDGNSLTKLPEDLVEIESVWERPADTDQPYTPMTRKMDIPEYLASIEGSSFQIWSFDQEKLHVPPSTIDEEIKIDYVRNLFTPATINSINVPIRVLRAESYLRYRTAALCSYFIGENENRAIALQKEAEKAMERSVGISIKGRQSIKVRRLPFRAAYKQRRIV